MGHLRILAAVLLLAVVAPAVASGDESEARREVDPEAVRREVLELQARIDELLASLPPAARSAVEESLRRGETPEVVDPGPEPEPSPAPGALDPLEPSAAEPAPVDLPVEPPVEHAVNAVATPSPVAAPEAEPECVPLAALDDNADGVLSATDRHWRHLFLSRIETRGAPDPDATESLFEAGIRQIDLAASTYTDKDRVVGDVHWSGRARLHLLGKRGRGPAWLVIDAAGLSRGGQLTLVDDVGGSLDGFVVLEATMVVRSTAGALPLFCP